MLSFESPAPIVKQGSRWQLTAAQLSNGFWERAERLTALRHEEQAQMQEYLTLGSEHMEFLIRALDGNPENIRQPDLPSLPVDTSREMTLKAVEFLRHTNVSIEPRRQWASPRKTIPENQRAEAGRALCYWGDSGWGDMVREGKYQHQRFSDELVAASVQLIRDWNPHPALVWVTCIPSRRHPTLVKDFAGRLAACLGLPFREALNKTDDRPEQKEMANSAQQARNVEDSLAVISVQLVNAPVLLVDDIVDSRWTFTIATALLRDNGCGPVHPFALADASTG